MTNEPTQKMIIFIMLKGHVTKGKPKNTNQIFDELALVRWCMALAE